MEVFDLMVDDALGMSYEFLVVVVAVVAVDRLRVALAEGAYALRVGVV